MGCREWIYQFLNSNAVSKLFPKKCIFPVYKAGENQSSIPFFLQVQPKNTRMLYIRTHKTNNTAAYHMTDNPQGIRHRTQANMFNLTYILTHLRASVFNSFDFSQDDFSADLQDFSAKYMKLVLFSVTALILFQVAKSRELRERDRRQQARLSAVEHGMTNL